MSTNLVFDGNPNKYQPGDPLLELSQEKRAYVEEMAYYCQQEYARRVSAGEDWVLPEVALGQAILETGWGQSRGANDFGIKSWQGSDRPKSTLATSEQNSDGSYVNIDAAFEKTSSIQDSVALYYDFITSVSRYSKALNLTDPYKSIQEIRAAGYATSLSYADNVSYIINHYNLSRFSQLATSFDYNPAGYEAGVSAYEDALKIVIELKATIETSEANMKSLCNQTPKIDYDTLINYRKSIEVVTQLMDLLEKTKGIADREKYIAEQYNGGNDGANGLNTFQVANLALGTLNYAFTNNEDFTKMVTEYKNTGSSEVFATWFESYVSQNGIASNIIDMKQYTAKIKETYAVPSNDFVVSQAEQIFSSTNQTTAATQTQTTNTNTYRPSYNYTSNNNQQFTSSSQSTRPTTTTTTPPTYTPTTTAPITQPVQNQNVIVSTAPTTTPSQNIITDFKNKVEDYVANHNNNLNSSIKDAFEQLTTPIVSVSPEYNTTPPTQPTYEIPTDSTISEVIPPTNDGPTKVTTTNNPLSNISNLAIGVGVGAAAIGIGAGTYYIARRNKDTSQIEDIEYLEEEEPIYKPKPKVNKNPYRDNYYEDENNFFPLDSLDDNDEADDFNVEEEKYTIAAERNKNVQEEADYDTYHEDDYE